MTNLDNSSQEIWKDIKGFENAYQVSSAGNIKSLQRLVKHGRNGSFRAIKERIMRFSKSGSGYFQLKLSKESITDNLFVHLLVWDHFGDSKRDKFNLQVDHIDNNKLNNAICNLQLLTARNNTTKTRNGSKLIGAYSSGKIWRARIFINGKNRHIGKYQTEQLAHEAYLKRRAEL